MSRSCLLILTLLLLSAASAAAHGGGHGGDDDSDADASNPPPPGPTNLRSRSLILVKIWCLIIVFASTFVGGMSPYFMRWNEGFLVIGTQFAGGVFLATALMHFLSDANETFGDLTSVRYPFAFMLACAGYLLTMLADCVVGYVYGKSSEDARNGGGGGGGNSNSNADVEIQENARNFEGNHNPLPSKLHDTHPSKLPTTAATSLGDNILLISALCFHSVFEGIAIGVAETKDDAWRALWTVSLHKIFAAVAMGIALLRMIPDRPLLSCLAYAFAFAISSPIGVAVGIVIDATTQGAVADWIFAVSMGLACGVFVYVSINHLLSAAAATKGCGAEAEGARRRRRSYGFLAAVMGVGVIAVVMIWDT